MRPERPATVVRYHPAVGAVFLVIGVVNVVLGILAVLRGDLTVSLVIGALFVVLGTLMLTRPYFRVRPDAVEVVGMIGVGGSEYRYRRLELTDGKLVAVSVDRTRKRVPVQRWFARRGDWDEMAATLEDGSRAPER